MNAVWGEKGSKDSQRLLFHHLSESPESVRGALTSLLIPHFKDGKIEIWRGTGETFMGLINLPPEIKSMVRQPLHLVHYYFDNYKFYCQQPIA